jgi:hypothetical protein
MLFAGLDFEVLKSFQHHGYALSHADAHRAEGIAPSGTLQLQSCRSHQTRPTRSKRMAERNGPAVRIYMGRVVGYFQIAQYRQRLGCESLVQLDYVHFGNGQSSEGKDFARGWNRPHAHYARSDSGDR